MLRSLNDKQNIKHISQFAILCWLDVDAQTASAGDSKTVVHHQPIATWKRHQCLTLEFTQIPVSLLHRDANSTQQTRILTLIINLP